MGVFARPAIVMPQTVRLDLGDDHWIEIKRELNTGETQQVASASRLDYTAQSIYLVAAYLLDWSLRDGNGEPLPLDTEAQRVAALKAISPAHFNAIFEAINRHVEEVQGEKKAEAPSGRRKSARISPSAA